MPSAQSPLSDHAVSCNDRFMAAGACDVDSMDQTRAANDADCVICTQLAGADGRYFGYLMRDARARTAIAQTIATSMGFCPDHAAVIASPGNKTPPALEATIREAGRHLGSLLERATLQDELLQDILFNARGRCPACAYFHRSEGRAVARVLHGLESDGKRAPLPPLCFVHTQLLVRRTEPPLRGRLVRQLRSIAHTAFEVLDTPAAIRFDDGVAAVCRVLYPLAHDRVPLADALCACPICEAIRNARGQWLMAAAENVRLEQPGWITLPTCRNHLLLCLVQTNRNLQRSALRRYVEAALPGRAAPTAQGAGEAPKRHRRSKLRWFNAVGCTAQSNSAAPAPGTFQREACPGCDAEEIAARRAIAQLIRKVSRAKHDDDALLATSGTCLKHFAEALIYASDPDIEHWLSAALRNTLQRTPGTS